MSDKETPLCELLVNVLGDELKMEKYNIKIDKKHIAFLEEIIMKNPKCLEKLEKSFVKIMEDGKIDVNDVPEILIFLKTLIELSKNMKNIKVSDVIILTKFIFDVLSKKFGLNEDIGKLIDVLIDTSLEIIQASNYNAKLFSSCKCH